MRLTTAQALVRWLTSQRAELVDGSEVPLFGGVFGIFGHGNVLGLGTALHEYRHVLPTWRGQNEQGMALAAAGFARATDRRQVMVATSSIGPGALNMITAAGLAHANRLPLLLLPGDTFVSRAPDPVLQQVEQFGDPGVSVNDAFKPVSRFFDRITRPEQLLQSLPQVARVLTDPADCGPVTLALPQDVQVETFDFPSAFFAQTLHRVPRPRPDRSAVARAAELIGRARRPLLICGGGVRYSGAAAELLTLAESCGIPIAETAAGRTLVPDRHRLNAGPLGTIGSASANAVAEQADLIIAVGTRLQDFTTSSWTVFGSDARVVTINAAAFDAVKHGAHPVVADAREALVELTSALAGFRADVSWSESVGSEREKWNGHIDGLRTAGGMLSYAQVVGVVNDESTDQDYVLGSSGGIPGELNGGWRTVGSGGRSTMDLEYGFSCMGYEICGPWGAAIARAATNPDGVVTALLGDGSYLMLNSELFSAAFAGHPFVAVVCDNGGYAVIHRLQTGQGADAFNNLLVDCAGPGAAVDGVRVDFAAHAAALGCAVVDVPVGADVEQLRLAYRDAKAQAREQHRPAVLVCRVSPSAWTESGAWWQVGVGEQLAGRAGYDRAKAGQVRWAAP